MSEFYSKTKVSFKGENSLKLIPVALSIGYSISSCQLNVIIIYPWKHVNLPFKMFSNILKSIIIHTEQKQLKIP